MTILRVDAKGETPQLNCGSDLQTTLQNTLSRIPKDAPIVILIHGYKFSPFYKPADPTPHIYSLCPRNQGWKAISWPRHLGFGKDKPEEGLCIAFAWEARGSIWQAWRSADASGKALSKLIQLIRAIRDTQVHFVAHSLGARVVFSAFPGLRPGSVGRAVLMAAAEFQSNAQAALDTPAGQRAEFINVTSRENDLFDALVEWSIWPGGRGECALGAGLGLLSERWVDIQIDRRATRRALDFMGFHVPPPKVSICHWSAYLRPGLLLFYGSLIRHRSDITLEELRRALPRECSPRWSLLLAKLPIPSFGKLFRGSPS